MRFPALVATALLLASCGYHCRWRSHGACIAAPDGVPRIAGSAGGPEWTEEQWQKVLDDTIENALTYWNRGGIEGWTIALTNDAPTCFMFFTEHGCVYPIPFDEVIHVQAPPDCPTEYIVHEIGHAVISGGDPTHTDGAFETLDRNPKLVARCDPYSTP